MVPINEMKVGDMIKIVDRWSDVYPKEEADTFPSDWNKYLGNVYRITNVGRSSIRINTDPFMMFYPQDIECIIGGYGDFTGEVAPVSKPVSALLFG